MPSTTIVMYLTLAVGLRPIATEALTLEVTTVCPCVVGAPIAAELVLINDGDTERVVDLGDDRLGHMSIRVVRRGALEDLHRSERRKHEMFGGGEINIPAHERYRQTIFLNEWFRFDEPGNTELMINLVVPVREGRSTESRINLAKRIWIQVDAGDDAKLQQLCTSWLQTALHDTNSSRRMDAIEMLGHVSRPVAVPFLARVFEESNVLWFVSLAADGLYRNGSHEAFVALQDLARQGTEKAEIAQGLLNQWKQP